MVTSPARYTSHADFGHVCSGRTIASSAPARRTPPASSARRFISFASLEMELASVIDRSLISR